MVEGGCRSFRVLVTTDSTIGSRKRLAKYSRFYIA